ncbi:MAG: paraquat-inducible protein B [Planctomycetota bacterium]|jgi:paraquat-inducible protein B
MKQSTQDTPPVALVEQSSRSLWVFALPLFALGLAAWLMLQARADTGLLITVRASDGHGIGAGDSVRYRGIQVGRVEDARLSTGLDEVVFDVRLAPFATGLAREGTGFWVARPRVAIESIAGLETLFGARYISVVTGPSGGAPRRSFQALLDPPLSERFEEDGLELVLEAPRRFGLAPGAPVRHRGIDVGSVVAVGLAADGARVEVRVYVRPDYTGLVRANTSFWETGGAEVSVGITSGFNVNVDSLRGLLIGGVAFATPDEAGVAVEDGQRFPLGADSVQDADDWQPALGVGRDLGDSQGLEQVSVPSLRMTWIEGRVFKSDKELSGWGVVVDGFLIGPTELLVAPEKAREGSVLWFFDGQERALFGAAVREQGGLSALQLPSDLMDDLVHVQARQVTEPEACLVLGASDMPPIALDPSRLLVSDGVWLVDKGLQIDPNRNGAPVLARSDGKLLGILIVDKTVEIRPIP